MSEKNISVNQRSSAAQYFALAALTAAALLSNGSSAAEIHLRANCQCEKPLVTLADVAEIFPADDAAAQALASVELFPAPAAGRKRLCKAREIYDVLVQRGVDLKQHRLSGASAISITAPAAAAPVENTLRDAPPANEPAATKASANAVPKMLPPEVLNAADAAMGVVAARSLARGQLITTADLRLEPIDPQFATGASLTIEQVVGQESLRAIPAGQIVAAADFRSPRLVHRGEIVTVFARTHGVQVRTTAKAIDEGGQGDLIALESLLTKDARFTARVVGRKEVEVMAGAPRIETEGEPTPLPRAVNREKMFELRVGNQQ